MRLLIEYEKREREGKERSGRGEKRSGKVQERRNGRGRGGIERNGIGRGGRGRWGIGGGSWRRGMGFGLRSGLGSRKAAIRGGGAVSYKGVAFAWRKIPRGFCLNFEVPGNQQFFLRVLVY